jgi:hypothetical protein
MFVVLDSTSAALLALQTQETLGNAAAARVDSARSRCAACTHF